MGGTEYRAKVLEFIDREPDAALLRELVELQQWTLEQWAGMGRRFKGEVGHFPHWLRMLESGIRDMAAERPSMPPEEAERQRGLAWEAMLKRLAEYLGVECIEVIHDETDPD